jgi:hypothetical protein
VLFADAVIAAAILDRLLNHCKVFNIKGHSYRLRQHAFSTQNLASQRTKKLITQTPNPFFGVVHSSMIEICTFLFNR